MRLSRALSIAAAAASPVFVTLPAAAAVVVVDFEDRDGPDVLVPEGYGGIQWNNKFRTSDTLPSPFTPHSGSTAAYFSTSDGAMSPTRTYTQSLAFAEDVLFKGAWIAGLSSSAGVTFMYYRDGLLLGESALNPTGTPQFLSGIDAAIDEIRVRATAGYFVVDDITYETGLGAVPEPATWAMMVAGFGLIGGTLRRRRSQRAIPA